MRNILIIIILIKIIIYATLASIITTIIHEIGHFLICTIYNVKIKEFSIGRNYIMGKKCEELFGFNFRGCRICIYKRFFETGRIVPKQDFENLSPLKKIRIYRAGIMFVMLTVISVILYGIFSGIFVQQCESLWVIQYKNKFDMFLKFVDNIKFIVIYIAVAFVEVLMGLTYGDDGKQIRQLKKHL